MRFSGVGAERALREKGVKVVKYREKKKGIGRPIIIATWLSRGSHGAAIAWQVWGLCCGYCHLDPVTAT